MLAVSSSLFGVQKARYEFLKSIQNILMCQNCESLLISFLSYNLQVVVKASSVYHKDTEAPPCGVDDMTKLAYLHEPGVLDNLRSRYDINEIYVCIPDTNSRNFVSLVS